jgi:2-hydroxycyclohexanecarboxyl-CoA dehydrogenase
MNYDLSGKTVIVTGGSSHIGYATVLAFAQEGANVTIADIDEEQGQKVAEQANKLGGRAMVVKTDVAQYAQVEKMVKATVKKYGTVDVLINNAGWDQTPSLLFIDTPLEVWDKSLDINYRGILNTCKIALPYMIEQKSGAIINLSSETGRIGEYKLAVYSGSKGAVISLSKALAKEVGRYGIRVNVVCPGMTVPTSPEEIGASSVFGKGASEHFTPEQLEKMTKNLPLRKLAKTTDVAHAILFLSSPVVSGQITGQTLSVDGGYTMI